MFKPKFKFYAEIILSLTITFASFSGCSLNTVGTSSKTAVDKTPITFTLWTEDANPDDQGFTNDVAKEITKETGVTLDITYPTRSITNSVDVMLAAGKYPDFMFSKYDEASRLESAGAYANLTPLIEKYAPNIKKVYGKYLKRNRFSSTGSAIYILGDAGVDDNQVEPIYGFEIQNRAVIEQGYPQISTLADYERVIKNSLKLHPTTNGKKTMGMLLCTDDWRWSISLGNMAYIATGLPDDGNYYINPDTLEAKLHWERPQEKKYYKWLNKLYNEGIIASDSFTETYQQYIDKISSGAVLGLTDSVWEYKTADTALRASGKYGLCYGLYPAQLDGTTKMDQFRDVGFGGSTPGIGISVSCKDKIRAIKFIDWLSSDEGQILRNWGIEGKNYTVDSSGKRIISESEWHSRNSDPDYKKETGIGVYNNYAPMYGQGVKDKSGNYYDPTTRETEIMSLSDVDKKVLNHYKTYKSGKKAQIWADLFPGKNECSKTCWGYGAAVSVPGSAQCEIKGAVIKPVIKEDLCDLVICRQSQFEQYYQSFVNDLEKYDADEIDADFTKYVRKTAALYK